MLAMNYAKKSMDQIRRLQSIELASLQSWDQIPLEGVNTEFLWYVIPN